MSSTIPAKLCFNGERRRVQFSAADPIEKLMETVHALFPHAPKHASVSYVDEDGDAIVVRTNAELKVAFLFFQGKTALKLDVITTTPMSPWQQDMPNEGSDVDTSSKEIVHEADEDFLWLEKPEPDSEDEEKLMKSVLTLGDVQERLNNALDCNDVPTIEQLMKEGSVLRKRLIPPVTAEKEDAMIAASGKEASEIKVESELPKFPLTDGSNVKLGETDEHVDGAEFALVEPDIAKTSEKVKEPESLLARLPELSQQVQHGDARVQLEATTQFRKLLSIENNPPIEEVIATNVVPQFIHFLALNDSPTLQFEAAWAITNIVSGTTEHTRFAIDQGAIPAFVALLQSDNDDVREQAVWGLGNIAGDSPTCRNQVLHAGALMPLLSQLQPSTKLSMQRNATWTLSNFCRGKPQPAFDLVKPALPTLAQIISQQDDEVLTDACWALSYLSEGPNEHIQAVIESGVCMRLVELLMHPSTMVQTPALRVVGNIVTGDDLQTQVIINCSALPCILSLLSSPKKNIRKEACWTISNITAGSSVQIKDVIEANVIPALVNLLANAEFDIKKEAVWAISNATSGGTPEQINFLVAQGCIPPLCDVLEVSDTKIVMVALEGLENILKVGESLSAPQGKNPHAIAVERANGLEKIDKLQQHENNDIYERAVKIVEKYFGAVDEEAMELQLPVAYDFQPSEFQPFDNVPKAALEDFPAAVVVRDVSAAQTFGAPANESISNSRSGKPKQRLSLKDLLEKKFVRVGGTLSIKTFFTGARKPSFPGNANILDDGKLCYDGKTYKSLFRFVKAAKGYSDCPWKCVFYEGKPLDFYRQEAFRAFPGEFNGPASNTTELAPVITDNLTALVASVDMTMEQAVAMSPPPVKASTEQQPLQGHSVFVDPMVHDLPELEIVEQTTKVVAAKDDVAVVSQDPGLDEAMLDFQMTKNRLELENNRLKLETNRLELEYNRLKLENNRLKLANNRLKLAKTQLELEMKRPQESR